MAPSLWVDGAPLPGLTIHTLVDDAVVADAARERTALIARAAVRATAKYALRKAVKDKSGDVAGKVANFGASLLERADIRSWHQLPQELSLIHVPLAPGRHQVSVAIGDGLTAVGEVDVRAGALTIATVRLWHEPAPRPLFATAVD